jgi:hypothetical protein
MKTMLLATLVLTAGASRAAGQAAHPPAPNAAAQDTAVPAPQEIATIAVGTTRGGMLEIGDYTMGDATWADVWYITLTAGQRVTIDLRSRQFDPYMQFLDPWGGKLAEDDDGGDGNASHLVVTAREAGRYQIVVNSSQDVPRTGTYSLSVR